MTIWILLLREIWGVEWEIQKNKKLKFRVREIWGTADFVSFLWCSFGKSH